MQTVLILGARAPIALEMARAFAANGNRVIMADSLTLTLSRWSNSVSRYYRLPSPAFNTTQFIKQLKEIIQHEKIEHLIPTCEEAFYVSMHKKEFLCKVWTAEFPIMKQLHHKLEFIQFATSYFSVPETLPAKSFKDWENCSNYVFKPIYSRFATSAIIGKAEQKCFKVKKKPSDWLAQKLIRGKEICVYSIWDEGTMKAFCAYHPLFRVGQGSGIYFEPYYDEKLFLQVKNFGEKIGYTGQLCFDFIVNDQGAYVLECNPRGTSGAHLIHQQLAPSFLTKEVCIRKGSKAFSIKYALLLLKPFLLFSKHFYLSSDVIFQWKDPIPFLLQPLSLLEITYIKFRDHKTWLEATTGDIEWNGND